MMGSSFPSKEVVQEHNENILEGGNSIKVAQKTLCTGGQQENPKIGASTTKESKGRGKHKGKKPKVTFAQLLKNIRR